jgi:signal transduction histidine kinase
VAVPSDPKLPNQAWPPLGTALSLGGLALLVWGVGDQVHLGFHGSHLLALCLLVLAASSWIAWVRLRIKGPSGLCATALVAMAIAGGFLVPYAPVAVVFIAVAALGGSIGWPIFTATLISAIGLLSMLAGLGLVGHHGFGSVAEGLAAALIGMVTGISRRQAVERTKQAMIVTVEKDRAEIERSRAELLAERNRLARELHDVLAHTLAALSLQLEAFETVVDSDGSATPAIREQLSRTRKLVHEGLDEARGAVQALRANPIPLEDQLARLCAEHDAVFAVSGSPRALPPEVSLSLYRVTQEALTNIVKHAPGAPTRVNLAFAPETVSLDVENARPRSPSSALAGSGGGFGLQGISERLALLGGYMESGPSSEGWRIAAEVPTPV